MLRLLHPDGSLQTRICDDEGVLVGVALALHDELIMCGWGPCPEPAHTWAKSFSRKTFPDQCFFSLNLGFYRVPTCPAVGLMSFDSTLSLLRRGLS